MSLRIAGTGRALPEKAVSNADLSTYLDTNDEWITTKSGIKSRMVCTHESLTDLAEAAGLSALGEAGVETSDIDLIICATINGDLSTPSLACTVAERLGIKRPAFDVNAACTGFIYALDVAEAYINTGKANNILLVCAEMMSKHVDWTDRSTCVLFGDGAGACVLTKGNALKYIRLSADGNSELLYRKTGRGNNPFVSDDKNGFLRMRGQDVFKFAVHTAEKEAKLAMSELNRTPEDIDYFILHQANLRIIESARARLKQPQSKFPVNISKYGNMSSASIPILLDEMLEKGEIKTGDSLLLVSFGAGMTAGVCILDWE